MAAIAALMVSRVSRELRSSTKAGGCQMAGFSLKKGGEGVFLRNSPRMSLMVLGLRGGYLVSFARFCDTFCDVFARAVRPLWSPTLAWQARNTGKGTARMEHPAFLAPATIFRIFSCMVFALRGITSIVRFRGLIACKVGQLIFAGLVVCFVGFGGWYGNWGA